MKLRANKNGKGYVTSYTLPIGCKEAREAGFLTEDGTPVELEKVVSDGEIAFRVISQDDQKGNSK